MTAKDVYLATPIGGTGTLTCEDRPLSISDYERFAREVDVLKGIEDQGLITITLKHPETGTGRKFTDLVRFKRLG